MKARLAALAAVAALAVAGCQNSVAAINRNPTVGAMTAEAGSDGIQKITVVVNDTYRFYPSTLTVHPGTVQITLKHEGTGAPHDLSVVGLPADFVPLTHAGQTSTASFTAPAPGRYTFVCTIHEAQGQTGALIVLPR